MATINLSYEVSDEVLARLLYSYARSQGYSAKISNPESRQEYFDRVGNDVDYQEIIDNPKDLSVFMREAVRDHIQQAVKGWEAREAKALAEAQVAADVSEKVVLV